MADDAGGGGCLTLSVNDMAAWIEGLRRVLTDERLVGELTRAALNRPLPTWRESAEAVLAVLR